MDAESKPTPRPTGRPTKYEERFCDLVEEKMGAGLSLTAFAWYIGVTRDTLNEWTRVHPLFSDAVMRAKAKRLLHWEMLGLRIAKDGGGQGSATMTIFGLKNMDRGASNEWTDRQEHELSGPGGAPMSVKVIEDAAASFRTKFARAIAALRQEIKPPDTTET